MDFERKTEETFGKRLLRLRKKENKSLRVVAEEIGISYQALNFYENDKRDPSIWVVKKIADYYGVTIDELIGTEELK